MIKMNNRNSFRIRFMEQIQGLESQTLSPGELAEKQNRRNCQTDYKRPPRRLYEISEDFYCLLVTVYETTSLLVLHQPHLHRFPFKRILHHRSIRGRGGKG